MNENLIKLILLPDYSFKMIKCIKRYSLPKLLIGLFFFTSSSVALAQNYKHEISGALENDVYIAFRQDRYYTHGTLLHYRFAPDLPSGSTRKINSNLEKITAEFEVGQKIFTPYYASAPDPKLHDRPFTGYLFAAAALNRFYKNENMFGVRIEAGMIGEAARGKEAQESFHKTFGIYEPKGWEYQLKSEFGLNLKLDYQNLLIRSANERFDMTFVSSALVGSTFSGANIGMMLRIGKMNPLYRSVSNNTLISSNSSESRSGELFLFTVPRINYVAYDATIQGGLFREDKGPVIFDAQKLVYSQQVGLGFSAQRWSVGYTVMFRGKEVKSAAKPYYYASGFLAYRFN